MTERADQSLVVVFGKDFKSFQKRLSYQIERKAIFVQILPKVSHNCNIFYLQRQ